MRAPGIVVAIIVIFCGTPGMAADGIEQGHAIVEANCAGCHALGIAGAPWRKPVRSAAPRSRNITSLCVCFDVTIDRFE